MKFIQTVSFLILLLFSLPLTVQAQEEEPLQAPNVYLDCYSCYFDYVRTQIEFVNYVRDQSDAHVYLRITDAQTGSGREYVLDFRGIEPFFSNRDTLTYVTSNTDTQAEVREGLVRHIRLGLIPFAVKTLAIENLDVLHRVPDREEDQSLSPLEDPWNHWIFDVDLGTSLDAEESELSYEVDGGLSAERITEMWKIDMQVEFELDRERIELTTGTRHVNRDSWEFDGFLAYSLGNRISAGLYSQLSYSQTGNIDLNVEASPAIEYSFFPYSEFQERRFVLRYQMTPSYRDYRETTIYLKESELVARQVLYANIRYDQPWGRIDIDITASNYMHDFSINRFEIGPSFNIRITRGLSVSLSGDYEIINDQISLPAEDITDTERLLGERQQATSFEYGISFGLSYTFGSQFSNTVNPRF
ncbi:MAG: hypothetical protein WDZ29_06505 [Balneolaceae bacterium]